MRTFDAYLNEQLQDPEFRAEYEALEPEFAIIRAITKARKNSDLTQKELSERTGIAQGDISKIERGDANPTLATIKRLATGMGMKLKLEFEPMAVSR
jgi:ribosome-binding protein aMBF1 (putative translation factor)